MQGRGGVPTWRGYAMLSMAWLALFAVVLFLTRRPAGQAIDILPPPTPEAFAGEALTPVPVLLRVDVAGAVARPGVYTLATGSIVADAIAAAGGPADDAALDLVNKAVALRDEMQVYVPHFEPAGSAALLLAPQAMPVTQIPAAPPPVNINTATLEELDTLPDIGPVTAQRIIDGRPYGDIEDLMRVKGIGQATFDGLRALITVR